MVCHKHGPAICMRHDRAGAGDILLHCRDNFYFENGSIHRDRAKGRQTYLRNKAFLSTLEQRQMENVKISVSITH